MKLDLLWASALVLCLIQRLQLGLDLGFTFRLVSSVSVEAKPRTLRSVTPLHLQQSPSFFRILGILLVGSAHNPTKRNP